jgi:hypothetical protein
MPRKPIPAKGGAISTGKANPDAKLLRLVDKLDAACDAEERGADKVEELSAEIDRLEAEMQRQRAKIRKRIDKAEAKQVKRTAKTSRLLDRIMAMRARSVEGMAAKARARKLWNNDDWQTENMILNSIVEDLNGLARGN